MSDLLRQLRATLHRCPELAGDEVGTANVISSFVRSFGPNRIVSNLGGWGVAAVFEGTSPTPTVLVRAELDALPAATENREPRSPVPCAHLCGHDGHMAMAAGLAPLFAEAPPPCRVILLFQPAEEIGIGARCVIDDPRFPEIRPDYALALHNLPGYPRGQVVWRHDTFACSSVGMHATFDGRSSHAATPEMALSPLACMCALPQHLEQLAGQDAGRMLTITHLSMGPPSFGITPGHGRLLATLRSERTDDLQVFQAAAAHTLREEAARHDLELTLDWQDDFPETRCDRALVDALQVCCGDLQIPMVEAPRAFRWSDDFGHFGGVCPVLYFGLGAGQQWPSLHQDDYEFPDDLLPTGVAVFERLIRRVAAQHGA